LSRLCSALAPTPAAMSLIFADACIQGAPRL
jgi:hypothetical protein